MDKWRRQGDSARQTGLESTIQEVLTVVQSGYSVGKKIVGIFQIGVDFANIAPTRGEMDKWR